jgi:hypothetical protein
MYTLTLLMTAGAAIIGFCVMFAFFMREWNDIDCGMQLRPRPAEPNRNEDS